MRKHSARRRERYQGAIPMDIDEARNTVRKYHPSLDRLGPQYREFADACSGIIEYYQRHRGQLTPVRFADGWHLDGGTVRPQPQRPAWPTQADAKALAAEFLATGRTDTMRTKDQGGDEHWANVVTADPPGQVGPVKVMRLEPFTQYDLLADTDGTGGWLVRHAGVDNAIDPGAGSNGIGSSGTINVGTAPGPTTRDAAFYHATARRVRVARELASINLKAINAANRAAWSKVNGGK